jgi:transposase-like protein
MSILHAKYFHDEVAAYKFVEGHLWPQGPTCPKCGEYKRVSAMQGKSTRVGVYKCYKCRKPFTVKIGTIFESSHIKMRDWLVAIYLMASSKKGISSNQLARTLGVTVKSAWFMSHRIREAMRSGSLAIPMATGGGTVEIDETYIGRRKGSVVTAGAYHKHAILSLVSREDGQVRSFHVAEATRPFVMPIVRENIAKEARVITDEAPRYQALGEVFASHESVNHRAKEYARGDVTTNTVEAFFSVFKRGMRGVYQHCSEKHLHRYLAEFDHRHNNRVALGVNDQERALRTLRGVKGKRLTYRTTGGE